jgi:PAS domain S-box-containing protein
VRAGAARRLWAGGVLAAVLLGLWVATPRADAGEGATASGPALRSGCETDYPPFCLADDTGNAKGLSVALLRAALATMGRDVSSRVGPWDGIKRSPGQGDTQVLPLVGRKPLLSPDYCYAVAKGKRALLAQSSEGLQLLEANGEYRPVHEEWMGVYDVSQRRTAFVLKLVAGLAGVLVLILAGTLLWSRSLRRLVTERTADLQRSEQRLRSLLQVAPLGVAVVRDKVMVEANAQVCCMTGYPLEQLLGASLRRLYDSQADYETADRVLCGPTEAARHAGIESRWRRADGQDIPVHLAAAPLDAADPRQGIVLAAMDISELQRSQIATAESEARFRSLVGSAPEAILVQTGERFTYLNPACVRLLERSSSAALLGSSVLECFHPDDRTRIGAVLGRLSETQEQAELTDVAVVTLAGERIPVSMAAVRLYYGGQISALVFVRDLRALRHAEARLERVNRMLRAIRDVNQLIVRENTPEVIIQRTCTVLKECRSYRAALIVLTEDGGVRAYAQAGMDAGFGPLAADLAQGRLPPCCARAQQAGALVVANVATSCSGCPLAAACVGQTIASVPLAHGTRTYGYLTVVGDPDLSTDTEERELLVEMACDLGYALDTIAASAIRQRLEVELQQAQRMESIGRLAGGVAHDFNNMLMGIMGYIELSRDELPEGHTVRQYLDEVYRDAESCVGLTRQLLAFARKQTIAPEVLDLNDAVTGMLKILRRLLSEDIDLAWEPGTGSSVVMMDPAQVDQLLANLTANARDAMAGVGKFTLTTGSVTLDANACKAYPEATPGDYVTLTASDTGPGMDQETIRHLFEPFFTTKSFSENRGLGLPTVYGIVRQNGGFVKVSSTLGQGSTFTLFLPCYTAAAEHAPPAPSTAARGGSETILLVEDARSVRITTGLVLTALGYNVISAATPQEAITMASAHRSRIDLLISDVVMPGMSGPDLAVELAASGRDLKTLFISGYSADLIAHRGILDPGVTFIPKPFSREDLACTIRALLEHP